MALRSFAPVAAEAGAHGEAGINPWLVGAIVFAVLLALAFGLVAFGGGREHS